MYERIIISQSENCAYRLQQVIGFWVTPKRANYGNCPYALKVLTTAVGDDSENTIGVFSTSEQAAEEFERLMHWVVSPEDFWGHSQNKFRVEKNDE